MVRLIGWDEQTVRSTVCDGVGLRDTCKIFISSRSARIPQALANKLGEIGL